MARRVLGVQDWGVEEDESTGHRTYTVTWKVESEPYDGPARVIQTPGLYVIGAPYIVSGDVDTAAACLPGTRAKPMISGEACDHWLVTQRFSTKAMCDVIKFDDPLLQPQRVSGSSIGDKEEATTDRFGNPIINSAWEQLRGPAVEFARSRSKYRIEQNVPILQQELWEPMKNCVNDRPMWGMPRRSIRLADVSWERKYYGYCYKYFTRTFEFECMAGIHPVHGKVVSEFDRDVLDEGTKCLDGDWKGDNYIVKKIAGQDANPLNPAHFKKFKDRQGSNTHVILDGRGKPYIPDPPTIKVGNINVPQYYDVRGFTGSLSSLNVRLTLLQPSPDPTNSPFWWRGIATGGGQIDLRIKLDDTPPIYELLVPGSLSVSASYIKFAGDWDNVSANTMVVDPAETPSSIQPNSIVVIPGGTSTPGMRHIEYYGEANFFLLQVPLIF